MSDSSALPKSCPKCGIDLPSEATEGLCPRCLMAEAMQPTGAKTPAGPWQPPKAEELQKLLPQYEITALLGRGGMGAVYKGRQIALDRPVAIKILSNTLEEADASFAERFKNEARALGKLSHPGIVGVYDFGEAANGLLYIVMEFIDGTDVSRMIAKQKRLHTEHAMAITAHVCDALAYAHERGIIHRDIKPANIMVSYDGVVKVADFGLAKMSTSGGESLGLTQSGMAMGTLHYMAPEALMLGAGVDHRADIYAVGVMLYQMLTGKVPHGMFELPSLQVAGLDPRYDGIIAKAMREDRDIRYQSATEMRYDLDHILTQPVVKVEPEATQAPAALPTEARPQRTAAQPYRPPQVYVPPPKSKSAMGGSLVWLSLLAVLGVGGYFLFFRQSTAPANNGQDASNSATTPGAPPLLNLTLGKWTPAFTKLEDIHPRHRRADLGVLFQDGWFKAGNDKEYQLQRDNYDAAYTNFGVRATFSRKHRPNGGVDGNRIILRRNDTGERCQIFLDNNDCSCQVSQKNSAGDVQNWGVIKKKVTPSISVGETYTLEFVAIGNLLVARCNGQLMFATRDERNTKPGSAYILAYEDTSDVEFINLDTLPEAEALKIAGVDAQGRDLRSAPTPTKVITTVPTSVPSATPKATTPPAPLTDLDLQLAQLEQSFQAAVERDAGSAFKAAVAKLNAGYHRALDAAIATATQSALLDDVVQLKEEQAAMTKLPASAFPPPDEAKTPAALKTLRTTYRNAIAQYTTDYAKALVPLYEKYDQTLTTLQAEQTRASKIPEALRVKAKLEIMQHWSSTVLAKAVAQSGFISQQVLAAGPGTIQPGQPFTNSLGMKFVSVPGSKIHMCIHETRKQDYAAYAAENSGVDGSWKNVVILGKPVSTGDDHPVVAVSWEDATAFCSWLSKREGRTYRLPTEFEWNLAVVKDLADRTNVTPEALYGLVKDQYPWEGSTSSPPENAGRYRDSGKQFPTTAPVMSFKPNALGIYDLGGNAWEWCEDWLDGSHVGRVYRGASYDNFGGVMQSGRREGNLPTSRTSTVKYGSEDYPRTIGFRLVVEDDRKQSMSVSSAAANPVPATNYKPITNTLGMQFVPVPGTNVMFCIHETRRQDYAAFAAENSGVNSEWKNATWKGQSVSTANDHPVVNVSPIEAQLFCAWLSKKEKRTYRLPTDLEWSHAVGIGTLALEDPKLTPEERIPSSQEFPWGSQRYGNYLDTATVALFGTIGGAGAVRGYDDGYATTAPVMKYPANKLGLYDMGGNVSEICPDWKNAAHDEQVNRGGNWLSYGSGFLMSAYRGGGTKPDGRDVFTGFRVVMEGAPSAAVAPVSAPPAVVQVAPAKASATVIATKDAPFVNTLGMQFVPVLDTKVLMCIHETRKKDYAAYAEDSFGVDKHWEVVNIPGGLFIVSPTGEHPVHSIRWQDARRFCDWLSQKEGLIYRLPTDREWSFAVGIGKYEDANALPVDLHHKIKDAYPWGRQFPPPDNVGNYADVTMKNRFPNSPTIPGYDDGHLTMTPVMSYKPNQLGLYDLGGNGWEWVEDWFDAEKTMHVVRGGCTDTHGTLLLSSTRRARSPTEGFDHRVSFRVVLELPAP
jgi:formylglycine-generating enzyme required for sulfatase activity/serine/threonine protein kinase